MLYVTLHTIASLAATYVLFSFVEYSEHRWLMHRMRRIWLLRKLCMDHMAKHHKRGYRHTSREKDDSLLLISIVGMVPGVTVASVIGYFDPFTFWVMAVSGVVYTITWWLVHLEMHRDEQRFYGRNAVFRYLERRHVLHHAYPNANFNILLPLFDWVFGTRATKEQIARARHLRHEDVEEMAV